MIKELFEKQRLLMIAGVVSLVLGLVTVALIVLDPTEILGVNRWVKPMKFFFSIAIFVWTMAIYLNFLKGYERFSRIVSWVFIVVFTVEMIAIAGQPIRGTTSHFNIATAFDGAVFAMMGIAIVVSSLMVFAITVVYFRSKIDLPPALVLGMRLGLVIFLLGSIQGGYMAQHLSHTVGAADGGPGLPLTNWSTVAGDLRVAHFAGLHAIQAIPISGLIANRLMSSSGKTITALVGIAYLGFFIAVFLQALMGRPLIAL